MHNNFLQDTIIMYSKLEIPRIYEEIAKLDRAINWYLADHENCYIFCRKNININIVEFDIKSAFYTLCNLLFDPESDFIKKLNELQTKKERNIFISKSLKNTQYLKWLNILCKTIVLGIIFELKLVKILEIKKDGAVITCDSEVLYKLNEFINKKEYPGNFSKYISEKGIEFKLTEYDRYIRAYRTSWFWSIQNSLKIKGIYKYLPKKIEKHVLNLFNEESTDLEELNKIYSRKYLEIVLLNNLSEIINDCYLCSNGRFIDRDGKYCNQVNTIEPRNYLKIFIYPILLQNLDQNLD